MQSRAVQVLLLILSFVLALFLLIASSKYAAWAKEMTTTTGIWIPLVFYIGAIPLTSLVYTTTHLAAMQFNALPVPPYPTGDTDTDSTKPGSPASREASSYDYDIDYGVSSTMFVLGISILHFLAWFAQSILCTSCELAPILAGTQGLVPRWCPQFRFKDTGKPGLDDMLAKLATVKDFMQWGMVLLTIALVECARREYIRASRVQQEMFRGAGAGVDFGGPSRGAPSENGKHSGVTATTVELGTFTTTVEISKQVDDPAQHQQLVNNMAETQFVARSMSTRLQPNPRLPALPPGVDPPQRTLSRSRGPQQQQNATATVGLARGPSQSRNREQTPAYQNQRTASVAPTGLKRTGTLNHMYESRV
ncbi:hypothetical protein HRR83_006752 [Exophiala dermatitidis]|uniref:Uncharacterized protein n=2 Tax=Exophiala dermatitidis TaxID=5970 RepID=H6BVD2_EXODN|nr:uncharacterized protein HMPREF1120_03977 [Exophiala dermatitidis NIH/UT8656]KAJ4511490.1 hypothetical protein HRR75_005416 [Exophiala dermatitidis]EHY55862.1 hypothetical protein HMPREF1120_03977 [Exophiala dermatitidis NIH/UT8656]KAJ4514254.1 hypothetical protein HRR74_005913 [Exophiala dermatitidis]KAJ4515263.1 hypothetical protein HRR73_005094 [Exophiala dermatitidis]KAJ4535333.1 hypothetical protein HRR77_007951 [Exophiala dermatitidis]